MGEQTFLLIAASSSPKSKLIGIIDDVLAVDAAAKVTAKESAQTIVSNWLETVLPKSSKPWIVISIPDTSRRNMGAACIRMHQRCCWSHADEFKNGW